MNISVIIPNYNHAAYLPSRLSSITNQSYIDFEAIMLDDSSIDSSITILNKHALIDSRFQLYTNDLNSGSTFAQWNKGISLARGEFIWIAESDDFADDYLLESLLKQMEADSNIVLAYCQSNRINEKGEIVGNWIDFTSEFERGKLFEKDFIMSGKEYIQQFLIHRNTIPNASAVLFRKSVFDKIGGAPIHLKTNGDWLTWLKMLCFGNVAYVCSSLNNFRRHCESVIGKTHQIPETNTYRERYDYTMRQEFLSFLKGNEISFPLEVLHENAYYISLDLGNKGLFNLKKGYFLKGWKDIIKASFLSKFQSGFIKKGVRLK